MKNLSKDVVKINDGMVWLNLGNALISVDSLIEKSSPIIAKNIREWRDYILSNEGLQGMMGER
jgi:hypothetical protein